MTEAEVAVVSSEGSVRADSRRQGEPGSHEPYLTTGAVYLGSDRRVLAGVAPGVGYRFHLGAHLVFGAEARWILYLGAAVSGAVGAGYHFSLGPFRPLIGLQGAIYSGDYVGVISTSEPTPPSSVAWAVQLKLAPLRLTQSAFTVTFLSGDVGVGVDSGARAIAVTLTLLDIGVRF